MIENNRNQNQSSGNQNRDNQNPNQNNQTQNTSDQIGKGANPQDGDQWNNYRSRELSDQGSGTGNASRSKQNS